MSGSGERTNGRREKGNGKRKTGTVRHFTLDQANRTLPLVKRIVKDIVEEYRRWKDHVFRYEVVAAGSNAERGETEEQVALRLQLDESAQRINGYIGELSRIGCVFKGFEEGLVDFHSRMQGRDVFLCWKRGEESIEHWHELDAGFSGRQEIQPELVDG